LERPSFAVEDFPEVEEIQREVVGLEVQNLASFSIYLGRQPTEAQTQFRGFSIKA
jgi:hypothetical protein